MKTQYEQTYHEMEERYWWFRGRRDFIMRLMRAVSPDAAVLEVGCSGGVLLHDLRARGFTQLVGIDISPQAVQCCRTRGLDGVQQADARALPFPDETFDIVVASDILEHLPDADSAVAEWRRVLKPGGQLIVFVPAYQWLWSRHDEMNNHVKRYSYRELVGCLHRNQLAILRSGFWNSVLVAPIACVRLFQKMMPARFRSRATSGDLTAIPAWLNAALTALLVWENKLLMRGWTSRAGVSVFAIGRK
ncbi:MAG: class I SAM-dependent methyltransferase [Patescibacteria group bacterium]